MTEQIRVQPPFFEVVRHFGPSMAQVELPEQVTVNLTKMTDKLLKNPNTPNHGQQLAGVIHDEKLIYQQDFIEAGVNDMLEGCVRTYIHQSVSIDGKENTMADGTTVDFEVTSQINSAWIVSQYENEYNPSHNHTGCEVSGVVYLKTPDIKGRRKIPSKEGKRDHDGDIIFPYMSESQRDGELLSRGMLQIAPARGLMLLFPSWLIHSVYPFIGEGERRSIAFNANYIVSVGKEWIGGNNKSVQNEFVYWDKTKVKGETK